MPSKQECQLMLFIATQLDSEAFVTPNNSLSERFAILLAGWEIGLRPMTSKRLLYIVNGKVEPMGQAMAALVHAKDPTADFTFSDYTHEKVTVTLSRHGRVPITVSYTLADAERSGQLGKKVKAPDGSEGYPAKTNPAWIKYTRDMLAWNAIKRCCRLGAPELINAVQISVSNAQGLVETISPDADQMPFKEIPASAYNDGDLPESPAPDLQMTAEPDQPKSWRDCEGDEAAMGGNQEWNRWLESHGLAPDRDRQLEVINSMLSTVPGVKPMSGITALRKGHWIHVLEQAKPEMFGAPEDKDPYAD